MVCEDLPAAAVGGLGKHVVSLGNALIEAGHPVTLMGRDTPDYAACAAEIGFSGRFVAGFGNPFKGWKEKPLGVFLPAKRPYFARRIAEAIQREAPGHDVVHYHGHHPMVGRYLPPTLPFVQTRHDQGSDCITHIRFREGAVCDALDPRVCASCAHAEPGPLRTAVSAAAVRRYRRETAESFERHPVIFVSEFLRRNARRSLPKSAFEQSAVIHNFCAERALTRGDTPPEHGLFTVHVAGRIEPAKGILAFLQRLAPSLPANWQVNVFGDGPERPALADLAADRAIRLHGHVRLELAQRAAAAADVVVVPSVCEESCGTVILEALRAGRPCLALRRGGTPELARYGAPGQLRLFDDLGALVEHLLAWAGPVPAGGEPNDVTDRLPEILAVYETLRQRLGVAA